MAIFGKKKENSKDKVKKVKNEKDDVEIKAIKADKKNESKDKKVSEVTTTVNKQKNAYRILIKPLITEKASNIAVDGKYIFEVAINANKIEVAKAVYEIYGLKPVNVNIMNFQGKKVSRGKYVGKRKDWKKAIVTMAKGEKIDLH